jgi:hypothetical protein
MLKSCDHVGLKQSPKFLQKSPARREMWAMKDYLTSESDLR